MPPEACSSAGAAALARRRGRAPGGRARARAVEVDEVDAVCAGVGEPARERGRLAGPLDDLVVVALVQAHGALAEHVHGRNHLDRLCEPRSSELDHGAC